jgi:hypothetical protein
VAVSLTETTTIRTRTTRTTTTTTAKKKKTQPSKESHGIIERHSNDFLYFGLSIS